MNKNLSLTDKTLDALDQMIPPVSTLEIYNRMLTLGYVPGANIIRERADVSSALGKLRKANKVFSAHDESGVLLWDVKDHGVKPVLRLTNETKVGIRDEISRMRKEIPLQIIIAEVFDEIAQSLTHAAAVIRKLK